MLLSVEEIINVDSLYSEYQPLLDVKNNSIFAYEALMRSTLKINPLAVIETARKAGKLFEVDTTCITNAVEGFPNSYLNKHLLFINILPSTIIHDDFENFITHLLNNFSNIRKRVVFEISEDKDEEYIWCKHIFAERLNFLKSLDFFIAFDDLTISKFSIKKMESYKPNFIKLDHTKSRDLTSSIVQQQLISLFLEYTNEKMKLILEGIEYEEDLLTAKKLGVPFVQGYFISKPKSLG